MWKLCENSYPRPRAAAATRGDSYHLASAIGSAGLGCLARRTDGRSTRARCRGARALAPAPGVLPVLPRSLAASRRVPGRRAKRTSHRCGAAPARPVASAPADELETAVLAACQAWDGADPDRAGHLLAVRYSWRATSVTPEALGRRCPSGGTGHQDESDEDRLVATSQLVARRARPARTRRGRGAPGRQQRHRPLNHGHGAPIGTARQSRMGRMHQAPTSPGVGCRTPARPENRWTSPVHWPHQ